MPWPDGSCSPYRQSCRRRLRPTTGRRVPGCSERPQSARSRLCLWAIVITLIDGLPARIANALVVEQVFDLLVQQVKNLLHEQSGYVNHSASSIWRVASTAATVCLL